VSKQCLEYFQYYEGDFLLSRATANWYLVAELPTEFHHHYCHHNHHHHHDHVYLFKDIKKATKQKNCRTGMTGLKALTVNLFSSINYFKAKF